MYQSFESYDADVHRYDRRYPDCALCKEPVLAGQEYVKVHGKYYHIECVEHDEMEERGSDWDEF